MSDIQDIHYLEREGKPRLAYLYSTARAEYSEAPVVVFCGGFKSDMMGTKAEFLEAQCREAGYGFLRMDYAGHGHSDGRFEDGTIGRWTGDVCDVLAHLDLEQFVVVGSSMGGWIGFLLARTMRKRMSGLVGIAAAPDFTDDLYYNRLNDEQRAVIERDGRIEIPNDYSEEPYIFTKALIEDGRKNFILGQSETLHYDFPIHLIQGKKDADVPWRRAEEIRDAVLQPTVDITFIEEGDHRLSRDEDLALLWTVVRGMVLLVTPR